MTEPRRVAKCGWKCRKNDQHYPKIISSDNIIRMTAYICVGQ
jgi:hypothetical protein